MDVIGHEDMGVDAAAMMRKPWGLCGLSEPATVLSIVVFAEEDRPTIVATLDHVEQLIGQEGATEPGHGTSHLGQGAVSLPRPQLASHIGLEIESLAIESR
jgi:hypothetical protein